MEDQNYNLQELLEIFLKHRKEVITNRSLYELRQAKDRGHIVEGLIVAIANIDEVINIINIRKYQKLQQIDCVSRIGLQKQ